MPTRSRQSRGACRFCGQTFAKGGLTRHLTRCGERQAAIEAANARKSGAAQTLYHLRVQDAYGPHFWLDLEMNGSATLKELDRYLRAIWLECCGHLSQFGDWGEEVPFGRKVSQVFQPGVELRHIYDFGTSSETLIKAVGTRQGKPLSRHPIFLMARNELPEVTCQACGQPATWLCVECLYEEEQEGWLCDAHAETHPHEDYGEPLPIVNSPRLGMCGYSGPAEPPY